MNLMTADRAALEALHQDLLEKFEKNPTKVIEEYVGFDLPDDQVNALIKGIQAKITADKVGDALGALGGLFGKK